MHVLCDRQMSLLAIVIVDLLLRPWYIFKEAFKHLAVGRIFIVSSQEGMSFQTIERVNDPWPRHSGL
jgi:hypothetical protein